MRESDIPILVLSRSSSIFSILSLSSLASLSLSLSFLSLLSSMASNLLLSSSLSSLSRPFLSLLLSSLSSLYESTTFCFRIWVLDSIPLKKGKLEFDHYSSFWGSQFELSQFEFLCCKNFSLPTLSQFFFNGLILKIKFWQFIYQILSQFTFEFSHSSSFWVLSEFELLTFGHNLNYWLLSQRAQEVGH